MKEKPLDKIKNLAEIYLLLNPYNYNENKQFL